MHSLRMPHVMPACLDSARIVERDVASHGDACLQRVATACSHWSVAMHGASDSAAALASMYENSVYSDASLVRVPATTLLSLSSVKASPPIRGGGVKQLLSSSFVRSAAIPTTPAVSTPHQPPLSASSTSSTNARQRDVDRGPTTLVSSFLCCLDAGIDAYWSKERSFTESFDQFLRRQFAPGLTRMLLQQRQGGDPHQDFLLSVASAVANADQDSVNSSLPSDDAELSNVSYVALAAEVSRLQSVFVTSVLSQIDAERQLRAGRAMYRRALVLQRDHPRIAGWTRSQLCRHIEQCRQETASLLAAADMTLKQSLPELLAQLAPLVCARIVRKDNELKLERQAYFLSKLDLSVQWLQQQHSRLLALAAVLQNEHRYIEHGCHMLARFQSLVQEGVSVSTANAHHLQRLQRHLTLSNTCPAFVLASPAASTAVAFILHPIVQRMTSLWGTSAHECGTQEAVAVMATPMAAAIVDRAWHLLEEDVHSHIVALRQHSHHQHQHQRSALVAGGELASRGRVHLMYDCAAATQSTPFSFAWTPTSVATLLQRLEQESQSQSEAYRVLRQQDKDRLLVFSDLAADAARCSLPLEYEKHMWADFIARPADLVAQLQKLALLHST